MDLDISIAEIGDGSIGKYFYQQRPRLDKKLSRNCHSMVPVHYFPTGNKRTQRGHVLRSLNLFPTNNLSALVKKNLFVSRPLQRMGAGHRWMGEVILAERSQRRSGSN